MDYTTIFFFLHSQQQFKNTQRMFINGQWTECTIHRLSVYEQHV